MNVNEAVEYLTRAGYVVEIECGRIKVQDPYCGYNSGKYGVDGFNVVYVTPSKVWKFIYERE